ncbi:MAG TPA: hypothetical protein VFK23_00180 [Nitrospirota bacterium]|nr:hypothetical protein [Nitrospirota bacterium]
MDAAGRAEKELGAEIKVIRKTSTEYALEKNPPPRPSVIVNGRFIARNDTVTYQSLKAALLSDSDAGVTR